ncbi:MAG: hypothetical protein WC876_09110 [Candidatus Thermoplasmatota archaeon]
MTAWTVESALALLRKEGYSPQLNLPSDHPEYHIALDAFDRYFTQYVDRGTSYAGYESQKEKRDAVRFLLADIGAGSLPAGASPTMSDYQGFAAQQRASSPTFAASQPSLATTVPTPPRKSRVALGLGLTAASLLGLFLRRKKR